jgi:cytochrome c553
VIAGKRMKAAKHVRRFVAPTVIIGLCAVLAAFAAPDAFPDWAFPAANMQKPKAGWDATTPLELPGATRSFTDAALHDPYAAPDWFPSSHPPAPAVVLNGRPDKFVACGYCHLPDGSGRPENASLSGLPADYIRRQVTAFRTGTRKAAAPDWLATALMTRVAANATDQEIATAADYFAAIPARAHVQVVETDRITGSEAKAFVLRAAPGAGEPLGDRIVEGPSDFERFERRDPRLIYTAYVPLGALKRGEALAQTGGGGVTVACASCHGEGLRGGVGAVAPPLAGRSPTYVFRQLYGFLTGARGGEASLPMRGVVARLTQTDMIALAAYVGSLKP